MPDKFQINEKLGLLEITSTGIVTADDIDDSIEKSKAAFEKLGINKLIVDTTKQEKMPGTVSIHRIFSNFPRNISLALVAERNQLTENDIIFGENVAVNRGVRMRIFYNREEAIKWLNEE